MSNVFEQLVQYQKTETVHATMASSAGVLAGSTVGAAGAAASVVANFRSHPEKMQTLHLIRSTLSVELMIKHSED